MFPDDNEDVGGDGILNAREVRPVLLTTGYLPRRLTAVLASLCLSL